MVLKVEKEHIINTCVLILLRAVLVSTEKCISIFHFIFISHFYIPRYAWYFLIEEHLKTFLAYVITRCIIKYIAVQVHSVRVRRYFTSSFDSSWIPRHPAPAAMQPVIRQSCDDTTTMTTTGVLPSGDASHVAPIDTTWRLSSKVRQTLLNYDLIYTQRVPWQSNNTLPLSITIIVSYAITFS